MLVMTHLKAPSVYPFDAWADLHDGSTSQLHHDCDIENQQVELKHYT